MAFAGHALPPRAPRARRSSPPPAAKAEPSLQRGGRTERHGLSSAIATLTADADRRAKPDGVHQVGVSVAGAASHPHPMRPATWLGRCARGRVGDGRSKSRTPPPPRTTKALPSPQGERRRARLRGHPATTDPPSDRCGYGRGGVWISCCSCSLIELGGEVVSVGLVAARRGHDDGERVRPHARHRGEPSPASMARGTAPE